MISECENFPESLGEKLSRRASDACGEDVDVDKVESTS